MNFEMNRSDSFDDDLDLTAETDRGGIIIPKQTCEHVQHVHLCKQIKSLANSQCIDCETTAENWLCLSCGQIHCSRYVNNHGEEHCLFTLLTDGQDNLGHCLTINFEDLSVWCYPCKSYIKNVRLNPLIQQLEKIKFSSSTVSEDEHGIENQTIQHLVSQSNPSTIIAIQDSALLNELQKRDLLSYCYTIKVRSACIDELTCLHSSDYVNTIVSAEKTHIGIPTNRFQIECNEGTLSNARLSAGTTIDTIENILNNHHINGFILTTSPGHRACRDQGYGTSIYNNLALAINLNLAEKTPEKNRKNSLALFDSNQHTHLVGATPIEDAICHMIHVLSPINDDRLNSSKSSLIDGNKKNKFQLERVLIIDLTSEHGSGLQSIYYESNQVFYLSIHEENQQSHSNHDQCGENHGLGHTMNIPLVGLEQMNDHDYRQITNELILPLVNEYQPQLIVVCVDFHLENVSTLFYAWLIEQLNSIQNSKLVVALDGNLSNISSKMSYFQTILSALIGKYSLNNHQWQTVITSEDIRRKIDLIKSKYKQYWTCFQ